MKQNRAEALLLASLTPYRSAKPAHQGRRGLIVPNSPYGLSGRNATLKKKKKKKKQTSKRVSRAVSRRSGAAMFGLGRNRDTPTLLLCL